MADDWQPVDQSDWKPVGGKVTLGDLGASAWNDIKKAGAGLYNSVVSGATLAGDAASGKAQLPSSQGVPGSVPFGDPNSAGLRVADMAMMANPVNPAVRSGDFAFPGVSRNLKLGKAEVPTTTQLDESADARYKANRGSAVDMDPGYWSEWARRMKTALDQEGHIDAPKNAPGTHDFLDRLQSVPGQEGDRAVQTFANIDAARRSLRGIAQNFSPENKADRAAASIAIGKLDEAFQAMPETAILAGTPADVAALKATTGKARGDYAAAQRSNKLTGELDEAHTGSFERATDNAESASSGRNIGNAIRQQTKGLLRSPKSISGYSPEEIAQMNTVKSGTVPMNVTRYGANLLGGGGGLGQALVSGMSGLAAGGGIASGNPLIAALAAVPPFAGIALKSAENRLTLKQAEKLDEMVRQRSPLYNERASEVPMEAGSVAAKSALIRALMGESNQKR